MVRYMVSDDLPEVVSSVTIEVDIVRLLDSILHKYECLRERGLPSFQAVVVVTLEEYKALEYAHEYPQFVPQIGGVVKIYKVEPLLSLMKGAPVTGLCVFGLPVIGSDNIGELSPLIL